MPKFTVEHLPDEANPANLPWCVLKHGRPCIWYGHEVFADGFAFAANTHPKANENGLFPESVVFNEAKDFVQEMPDDIARAEAYLKDKRLDHAPEESRREQTPYSAETPLDDFPGGVSAGDY